MARESSRETALVATPVARDQVIGRLQDHYAKSHIDVADFEARVEIAERAGTNQELMRALEGLPALESDADVVTAPGRVSTTIRATFGSTTRRGRWRVPGRARVRALFGSVELDLTEVELIHGETVIEVHAILGSVLITVPEGLAVECEGSALFGSFDQLAQSAASKKDARLVRIIGSARFGSVDIVVKKKSGGVLSAIKTIFLGG